MKTGMLATRRMFLQMAAGAPAWAGLTLPATGPSRPKSEPQRVSGRAALQRLTRRVEPVYPPMARGLGVGGVVSLDAVIEANGAVARIERIEGHPVLGRAAADAVKKWRFEPLTEGGKAATAVARFSFSFTP